MCGSSSLCRVLSAQLHRAASESEREADHLESGPGVRVAGPALGHQRDVLRVGCGLRGAHHRPPPGLERGRQLGLELDALCGLELVPQEPKTTRIFLAANSCSRSKMTQD